MTTAKTLTSRQQKMTNLKTAIRGLEEKRDRIDEMIRFYKKKLAGAIAEELKERDR